MQIKKIILRKADIALKLIVSQASNTRSSSAGLIVELHTTKNIIGYGECLPRPYVSGETMDEVIQAISIAADITTATTLNEAEDIILWRRQVIEKIQSANLKSQCAICALELAVLDALGKEKNCSAACFLGKPTLTTINYSAVVGEKMLDNFPMAEQLLKNLQFKNIKVKVGKNERQDIKTIQHIKKICPPATRIRVDANGAWSFEEAVDRVKALSKEGVTNIEQPMSRADNKRYPELLAAIPGGVCVWVDESICTTEDAIWFAEHNAASGFNLKISKNGGILNCLEILSTARKHKIPCQLGAQVGETSLLVAAGRLLSSIYGRFTYHEGAVGQYILEHDIVKHPLDFEFSGNASVVPILETHGLGITVETELINRLPVLLKRNTVRHSNPQRRTS